MSEAFPSTSDMDTSSAPQVVYGIRINDPSPTGHWHAVDMIRSSGARFDTTLNLWTIRLPADTEPLFASGRIGEALLQGAVSLERAA